MSFLPNTPSVLTVGYRCMEEGFEFIWRAYQRPFSRDSKGNKTYMDVRDYVPYLKSWKEGTAAPARRKPEPPIPASFVQDSPGPSLDQGPEVDDEENAEITNDEVNDEPLGSEVCCEDSDSAAEAGAHVVATPPPLPDESMSLHDLMTSDPDPPALKAKPKPKAKAKPKAEAKPKAASKAPKAESKPKSETSKLAKGKTASAVESDPGALSSSMVVEPPTSEVLTDPYGDEEGADFPGIEKLFEDYIPEEHSDVAVEDPAPEAVRSRSSSSKSGVSHASRRSAEVPKPDDKERKPPDPKDSDKRSPGRGRVKEGGQECPSPVDTYTQESVPYYLPES